MGGFRIKPWAVHVVGIILCLAAGLVIWFWLVTPLQARQQTAEATLEANQADATPAAQNAAKAQKDAAQKDHDAILAQWGVYEGKYMPKFDVSNRYAAWGQLAQELSYNLGPSIASYVPTTGVTLLTAISIQAPPNSPNSITGDPLVIPIASGSLQVGGDFRALLQSVIRWNDFHRLVQIDNLQLSGNSPYMLASYNAKVIIFPQNDTKLGAPISSAGAGGATAGGFGGGAMYYGGGGGGYATPPGR